MKRYLLFAWENYPSETSGGFEDFYGDFDTEDEFLEKIKEIESYDTNSDDPDWNYHVFDIEKRKIVFDSNDSFPNNILSRLGLK